MTLGELLEWVAAAGFTYGTYHATHQAWAAVLCASACLYYLAQNYALDNLPTRKRRVPPRAAQVNPRARKPTLKDRIIGTYYRTLVRRNRLVTFLKNRRPQRARKHEATVEVIPINQQPTGHGITELPLASVTDLLAGVDAPPHPSVDGS